MSCCKLLYHISFLLLFSCARENAKYENKEEMIDMPDLPLIYRGDILYSSDLAGFRVILVVNGRCWTCIQELSNIRALQTGFANRSDISLFACVTGVFDYEEIAPVLSLLRADFPVYVDRDGKVRKQLGREDNNFCLLVDSSNRIVWHGSIPTSKKDRRKLQKIICEFQRQY